MSYNIAPLHFKGILFDYTHRISLDRYNGQGHWFSSVTMTVRASTWEETFLLWPFQDFSFINMTSKVLDYMYVFFPKWVCILGTVEERRGYQIPWDRTYRWLWATMQAGNPTQFSARASVLLTSESSPALKDKVLKAKGILLCAAVRAQR